MRGDFCSLQLTEDRKWIERSWALSLAASGKTHGKGSKQCQRRFRLDIRKYFFTESVVKQQSRLPSKVVNASSLSAIEKHLEDILNTL